MHVLAISLCVWLYVFLVERLILNNLVGLIIFMDMEAKTKLVGKHWKIHF